MGKITGFMDYTRKTSTDVPPLERIENFNEFHVWLSREEQQTQAARCMDCGVPFCQAGMMIGGMASGCPLNNLIPEWNDLVYQGKWELALHRLRATNRFPEFTSRVCPALCEAACTCGDVTGSSVTVRENEHAIVETGYAKGWLHAAPPPARTGKSVTLEPMNPYERRVLHTALQNHPAVTTHSEGEEPNRRVVIMLKNQPERPEKSADKPQGEKPSRSRRSRRRGPRKPVNPAENQTANEPQETVAAPESPAAVDVLGVEE